MGVRLIALLFALALAGATAQRTEAAEAPRKVRMAFTSLSSVMCPPWIAREAGIFSKHGLDVEVIATPTGVEGMNALIAGEVQFLQVSGGTSASAALGGADVTVVATTLDSLVQQLIARPEIEKPEQLKGRSVGVTLRHFHRRRRPAGAPPFRIDSGERRGDRPGGRHGIHGRGASGQSHPGGHSFLSRNNPGAEAWASFLAGCCRARDSLRVHRHHHARPADRDDADLVRRYVTAQTEAIARAKRDKNFALKVMGKYLRAANPAALAESYEIDVQKYMLRAPLTTVEAMKSVLDNLAGRIPKAKESDPRKFFDDSFVRQLQTSGFIDALYR